MIMYFKNKKCNFFFKNKNIHIANKNTVIADWKHPYLSTAYVEPLIYEGQKNSINIYITDYEQSEYKRGYSENVFRLEYKINDFETCIVHDLKAGEYTLELPVLDVGEYEIQLQVIDNYGRRSHELLKKFRVIKELTEIETKIITDEDLMLYGINKFGSQNDLDMTNTRIGIQKMMDDCHKEGYKKIIIPFGEYRVSNDHLDWNGTTPPIHPSSLVIPSNFTLDLNGSTIKQHTFVSQSGMLFTFVNTDDSHIMNGVIEGDYNERDLTPTPEVPQYVGEFCGLISIQGDSKYTTVENVTIKNSVGYTTGIGVASGESVWGKVRYFENFKMGDVNEHGVDIEASDRCISDFNDISSQVEFGYTMPGRFLGMRGQQGKSSIVKLHFYDENKLFLGTKVCQQYRKIKIIPNSKYLRVTIYQDSNNVSGFTCYNMKIPYNCSFKNVHFENTRTCAVAFTTMNNCILENCTFDNCGQSITPVAIDLEDGWQQQQDFTMRNCEVINQAGTLDIIICAGYNIRMENCRNIRSSWRVDVIDAKISNCELQGLQYSGKMERIFNNTFLKDGASNGHGVEWMPEGYTVTIRNCNFLEAKINSGEKIEYRGCDFDYNNKTNNYHEVDLGNNKFYNCNFKNFSVWKSHIEGNIFKDCMFENFNVTINGINEFDRCKMTNCKFTSWLKETHIKLNNVHADTDSYFKLKLNDNRDSIKEFNSNINIIKY